MLGGVGALTLLASLGCEGDASVTIGVASGTAFVDAARLAAEEILAAEPIPGLDTIILVEEAGSTTPAIRDAERLVGTPGLIGVVGHASSASSLAAARIYNDRHVVQIAPAATAEAYRGIGPYSFRLVPADDRQGAFLAAYVDSVLPDRGRLALIYVNDDYGRGLRSAVAQRLRSSGVDLVLDLPYVDAADDQVDFSHVLDAVEASAPDALLWLARAASLDEFLGLLRGAGLQIPVIGSDAVASAVQIPDVDGRWSGVKYVDFLDVAGTEPLRAFRERYRARFGVDAGGLDALHYDAMALLLAGVRAGHRTGEDMREYLLSLGRERPPFEGITGPIAFGPGGEVERSYVMLEVAPVGSR
jgi:branched-chain amino acid transport system substrate-binding protein